MKKLKITVIGGGSTYTPELMDGIFKKKNELNLSEIVLMDINNDRLNIVGKFVQRMAKAYGFDIPIRLTLDRKEAIKGADFILTQIRVGGNEARVRDEKIPLEYNVIGQETTGAGGFAKSLRTIPVMLDIAKDIRELSPDAWLINFTNPSGIIAEALLKYGGVKAIGLCNAPIGMQMRAAKALGVEDGRLNFEYIGLNHLSWLSKIYLDGKDVTQKVIKKVAKEESLEFDPGLLTTLGILPSGYLRYYYHKDRLLEEEKSAEKTRGEIVLELEKELLEMYQNPNLTKKPEKLSKRGGANYSTVAVSLISSIAADKNDLQIVDVVNNSTTPDIPSDSAIETMCVVNAAGAHPLTVGAYPVSVRGLIQQVKAYEILTIEAGVTGDYNTALKALLNNPLIPSFKVAKALLDRILSVNKKYLPQFKI